MVNWRIFNNPKRLDKRNVAVAGAIYANIHTDWIRFFDRQDPRDFESAAAVCNGAIEDGFKAFANLLKSEKVPIVDLLYTWDFCRYLQQRAEDDDTTWDLFIHDDVYVRRFGLHIVTDHFLAWISKEHLVPQIQAHGLDQFAFLLFENANYPDEFYDGTTKTGYCFYYEKLPSLYQKVILLSQYGARIILQRILSRVQMYHYIHNEKSFLHYAFATSRWTPLGGFATDTSLFRSYPKEFLGDDQKPQKTAYQAGFERLFKGFKHYD